MMRRTGVTMSLQLEEQKEENDHFDGDGCIPALTVFMSAISN